MNSDPRHTEIFTDPASAFTPTPAQVKSRLLAWADERNTAGPTAGIRAGTAALGVGAAALVGVTLARVLIPRRKRSGAPGAPDTSFGTRLVRLVVLARTGAWLVPIAARTIKQLTTPAAPK